MYVFTLHDIFTLTAVSRWSFTGETTLKPICFLKKELKALDKKPFSYHHCGILAKYNLLSFENFKKL